MARISKEDGESKEGMIWELTHKRGTKFENIWPQNSIYYTSEDSISDPQARKKLVFEKRIGSDAIETALSVLMKTGWKPETTFSQEKYLKINKEEQIFWWKINREEKEEEKERSKEKGKERRTGEVKLTTQAIQDDKLAIGNIQISNNGKITSPHLSHQRKHYIYIEQDI